MALDPSDCSTLLGAFDAGVGADPVRGPPCATRCAGLAGAARGASGTKPVVDPRRPRTVPAPKARTLHVRRRIP